jgi:hypothetical protein
MKVQRIAEEEDSQFDNSEVGDLAQRKRKKKKKKKVPDYTYGPSEMDIKMARAYGGAPKATVKKKLMPIKSNARNI